MSSDLKDIPNRLKAMKKSGYGDGFGLRFSFSEMKGWRNEMEDAHCEVTNANMKIENWSFFCVFDGHGGDYCSKKSASHLWEKIYHRIKDFKKETKRNYDDLTEEEIIDAIKSGFYKMDDELRAQVETKENDSQYSSLYPTFLDKSGTTVNGCLITNKHIYLINCGDSRGIFVRRPAQIELVTFDHKPSQLKEKQRIQNAGGMIALNRVNGGLATSRGIGDFEYKCVPSLLPHQQFVSAEPDIYVIERDIPNDYFVVLACDGIWDVKKNDDVLKFVHERVDAAAAPEDLATITNQLIDSCFDSGSKDNMSVILIHFTPKGSNSARSAAAADRRESDRKDKEEQRREQERKEFNRDFHRQEREEKERERESRQHDDREREKKAKSLTHAIGAYPGAPTSSLPDFNKRKTNV